MSFFDSCYILFILDTLFGTFRSDPVILIAVRLPMSIIDIPHNRCHPISQKQYQSSLGDDSDDDPQKRNPLMPKTEKEKETLILEGKVQLVLLTIHKKKLQKASYGGIEAHFCFLDWEEYRKDPSACKFVLPS